MSTKYTYSKVINSDRLLTEIRTSSIAIQVSHIDTLGSDIYIYFTEELREEDITTLDNIVTTHESITLAEAKATRIESIRQARRDYLFARYEPDTRDVLRTIAFDAFTSSPQKTNRLNYVRPAAAWSVAVTAYCVQVENAINSQNSIAAVNAIPFNIAANTPPDPAVTITAALAIPD